MQWHAAKSEQGLSLIELLVALSVGLVAMGMTIGIFRMGTTAMNAVKPGIALEEVRLRIRLGLDCKRTVELNNIYCPVNRPGVVFYRANGRPLFQRTGFGSVMQVNSSRSEDAPFVRNIRARFGPQMGELIVEYQSGSSWRPLFDKSAPLACGPSRESQAFVDPYAIRNTLNANTAFTVPDVVYGDAASAQEACNALCMPRLVFWSNPAPNGDYNGRSGFRSPGDNELTHLRPGNVSDTVPAAISNLWLGGLTCSLR